MKPASSHFAQAFVFCILRVEGEGDRRPIRMSLTFKTILPGKVYLWGIRGQGVGLVLGEGGKVVDVGCQKI